MWFYIDFEVLKTLKQLPVDLYLKVSDQKFVKIGNAGESFETAERKHQENPDLEFCIKIEDQEAFQDCINLRLSSVDKAEIINVAEVISKMSERFGITEAVKNLISEHQKEGMKVIQKEKALKNLVSNIVKSESLLSSHAKIVCFISTYFADSMATGSISDFATASYLQNLSIDNDIFYSTELYPEKKEDLSWQQLKKFQTHPDAAASTVEKSKDISQNVISMIKDHHERVDGSGFPRKKTTKNLNMNSAVFIAANQISYISLRCHNDEEEFEKQLQNLLNEYQETPFKKIAEFINQFSKNIAS